MPPPLPLVFDPPVIVMPLIETSGPVTSITLPRVPAKRTVVRREVEEEEKGDAQELQRKKEHTETMPEMRLEALQAQRKVGMGRSDSLRFTSGHAFTLTGYRLGETSQMSRRGQCEGPEQCVVDRFIAIRTQKKRAVSPNSCADTAEGEAAHDAAQGTASAVRLRHQPASRLTHSR